MNNKFIKMVKYLLFVTPFIIGVVGLCVMQQESLLDAMYSCIQMYMLGYGGAISSPLVEIARWTAPLATASWVLLVMTRIRAALSNNIKYLCTDSVAVYGNESKQLLKQLGKRGISGKDRFVKAHRYILLNDEQENVAFYKKYQEKLQNRMVYIKCQSLKSQTTGDANIKLFSAEETAARLFWKQRQLYEMSVEKSHKLNLVIVGFGRLGEELLSCAVQNLIFSPSQQVQYCILGDGSEFTALHPNLDKLGEDIRFYNEPWYNHITCLEQADMVIVVQQENQQKLLTDMLGLLCRQTIDVFAKEPVGIGLLAGKERLRVFDWQQAAQNVEYILDERLLERAKKINLRYAHLYRGVEETQENLNVEWKKLDAFTRYSNISAADYHEVRLNMLSVMGINKDTAAEEPGGLGLLSELEHMRWCRYHYLNNWTYGIPADGRAKDPGRRIHAALIPYEDLTEEEIEKDRENIRVLLSI